MKKQLLKSVALYYRLDCLEDKLCVKLLIRRQLLQQLPSQTQKQSVYLKILIPTKTKLSFLLVRFMILSN